MQTAQRYRTRLIVLGASNVRRSLFLLLEMARGHLPGPIDFLIVAGHGRSYGAHNAVLGWSLPGISKSDWSRHWNRADTGARYAILTDVGNDLLFGNSSETLQRWVLESVQMISNADRFIVTGLPLDTASTIGPIHFFLFRKIFFPRSQVALRDILDRAKDLDRMLRQVSNNDSCGWLEPASEWYGWDPIHVRKKFLPLVWYRMLNSLLAQPDLGSEVGSSIASPGAVSSMVRRVRLRWSEQFRLVFSKAKEQSWLWMDQSAMQPFIELSDGSSVSFY